MKRQPSLASVAVAAAAVASTAGAAPREPLRITNDAGFTADCTLFVAGTGLMTAIRLAPGESHTQRIPANREVRLICLNGKTRAQLLLPGQAYRLIQVGGHLEFEPPAN